MGRKIPAKKHRGVKDPLKQQAQRFQSIKHKINAPPVDPDEQPVPRSLQRLFAFQEPAALAACATGKKKPKRPADNRGGRRDGNPVAALQRLPGEAARAFSLRINSAVRALHHPDDQDYPLDLEDMDNRGEYIAAQRERRQRKHRKALAAAERAVEREGGPPREGGAGERLRKTQRRALLKKEQQKAKEAETAAARAAAARELRYERVPFGAVAHAPPALSRPRRAPGPSGAPRPGRRALLLSSMLSGAGGAGGGAGGGGGGGGAGVAGGAGGAERERRERARLAAVAAYRDLRKQRAAAARHTKP